MPRSSPQAPRDHVPADADRIARSTETFGFVFAVLVAAAALAARNVSRVNEGHVGVYTRGGRLLPGLAQPGFHPCFTTSLEQIPIGMQTIKVQNVSCGTYFAFFVAGLCLQRRTRIQGQTAA